MYIQIKDRQALPEPPLAMHPLITGFPSGIPTVPRAVPGRFMLTFPMKPDNYTNDSIPGCHAHPPSIFGRESTGPFPCVPFGSGDPATARRRCVINSN